MIDDAATAEGLTDEQKEARSRAELQRQARLDAFAASLSKKRKQAIDARKQSGIEDEWIQDEEFYEGIDDANRDETRGPLKPVNQTGGASIAENRKSHAGSNLFLNITRPYVDFSAGRAADMLLPTDDRAWSIGPTPMPDIIEAIDDPESQTIMIGKQTPLAAAAKQMVEQARKAAEKAEKRIEDWHEEGRFTAELRKILKDAAKVGVAVLKGPIPVKRTSRAVMKNSETGMMQMVKKNETKPVSKRVDYWKFYPDPACGENIHNGSFVWEEDDITARQIRDLKGTKDADGQPMYIESAIDAVLEEGPQKRFENDRNYHAPDTEMFQIWYYHGIATAEDMAAAGVANVKLGDVIPVIVTMINDRVIKCERATLDSGDFPYDVMVWQPRAGHWTGIGVARQVRTSQRMINAANRNMLDNAGLAAGPQIVFRDGALIPADGSYKIVPRKFWKLDADSDVDDVRKAFAAIEIPIMQEQLLAIIQFALKMAEDCTGMPLLMQGQQGKAAETVGGMQIVNNNSNTPLRQIAKQFDDLITEPHICRYYEWLLMHGPDDSEKGDFQIVARGSSALFERDAQNQAIMAMAPFVKDPDFKIDPAKWITEWLKAQRLSPAQFQYTDEEWKEIEARMAEAPPPADPRIEVAKIKAETDRLRIENDTDRDTVYVQAEMQRAQATADAKREEMGLKYQLAMLEYANKKEITLEQAKVELSKVAMQLATQKELAGMGDEAKGPQVATPPTEPPKRADDGQAYQE